MGGFVPDCHTQTFVKVAKLEIFMALFKKQDGRRQTLWPEDSQIHMNSFETKFWRIRCVASLGVIPCEFKVSRGSTPIKAVHWQTKGTVKGLAHVTYSCTTQRHQCL
jgi:hypothetical protein